MFEVNSLGHGFKSKGEFKWLFKGLSFKLNEGKSLGIIGGPGAGKTTLIEVLCRLMKPAHGTVKSKSFLSWPVNRVVFEKKMSIRQNVRFLCRLIGEGDFERVEQYVVYFAQLGEEFHQPAERMTSQQRRRVSTGIAFALNFDIYFFDGPPISALGGDRKHYMELFQKKREKAQFVIASSVPRLLEPICDTGLILSGEDSKYYNDINTAIAKYVPKKHEIIKNIEDDDVDEEEEDNMGMF